MTGNGSCPDPEVDVKDERQAKIDSAIDLFQQGLTHRAIAAKLGVAPSTVAKWLVARGITRPAQARDGRTNEEIVAIMKETRSIAGLAKRLGISTDDAHKRYITAQAHINGGSMTRAEMAEARLNGATWDEIALRAGMSSSAVSRSVRRWMEKNGISENR